MQSFFEWFATTQSHKPWLIIGKGPSFNKIKSHDITAYNKISLNHAVDNLEVTISHIIDLDVLETSGESVLNNANFLLMPYYPHVNNAAGKKSLAELIEQRPVIKKMDEEGRLLWYNASTSKQIHASQPVVPVKYFSADAVTALLTMAGEKVIWSVGLDGGNTYGAAFNHLSDKTLLSNKRDSFNVQFLAIAESLKKYGAELIPLGETTIRIFVGAGEDQNIATKLLEYSIRMRSSASIKFMPLYDADIEIPTPIEKINRPRTPFSFQRFLIPQLCNYKGRGIYLDSDMQVFTDIRDLAYRDMNTQQILNATGPESGGRKPQFSVMLLDCESLQHWVIKDIISMLDRKEISYEQLMHEMQLATHSDITLETEWNSLEHFEIGKTKLLHYTDMETQPWLSTKNRFAEIWISELLEAMMHKFITHKEVKSEIFLGNIRPSLLFQIKTRLPDPKKMPLLARWLDILFTPPHRQRKWYQKNKYAKFLKALATYNLALLLAKFHRFN